MEVFKIENEYITIGQFLKVKGIIESGGQAKRYLHYNKVLLNGILCRQRGRKIYVGDILKIGVVSYEFSDK